MQLQFQNRFAGANGRFLEWTPEPQPLLRFCPDFHGGGSALWFHFRLALPEGAAPPPQATLQIQMDYVDLLAGLEESAGFRPVIRSEGRDWAHLRPGRLEITPDGRQSLIWEAPFPNPTLECACSFPYGRQDLRQFLSRHSAKGWEEAEIGLTGSGHALHRIANQPGNPDQPLPGLYLVARQCAGEPLSSWLMEGIFMELERMVRRPTILWAVPFADPDGLQRGIYGRQHPRSLSESWHARTDRSECAALQRDILRWQPRCSQPLLLNLEGTPRLSMEQFRVLHAEGESAAEREALAWGNVFREALDRSFRGAAISAPASPEEIHPDHSIHGWARKQGIPTLTIQTPWWLGRDKPITRKVWREAGKALAGALAQRWQQKSHA